MDVKEMECKAVNFALLRKGREASCCENGHETCEFLSSLGTVSSSRRELHGIN
jgi:hypothetical protein